MKSNEQSTIIEAPGDSIEKRRSKTKEAIKQAKIKREQADLVKHLYNIMDKTRPERYLSPITTNDRESLSECDDFLDNYDYHLHFHRRKTTISRHTKKERTRTSKEKKLMTFVENIKRRKTSHWKGGGRKPSELDFIIVVNG